VACVGLEDAGDIGGRGRALGHFLRWQLLEGIDLVALQRPHGVLPGPDLHGPGGRPQPAVAAKVGIDAGARAEGGDLAHVLLRGLGQHQRPFAAAELLQRQELDPPGHQEAAVAPARPAAADVGLDHRHVQRWFTFLELERRPQAAVAAADDAHVGPRLALERWRLIPVRRECLLQPVRSHHRAPPYRLSLRPVPSKMQQRSDAAAGRVDTLNRQAYTLPRLHAVR
jgi:hypothetical protein